MGMNTLVAYHRGQDARYTGGNIFCSFRTPNEAQKFVNDLFDGERIRVISERNDCGFDIDMDNIYIGTFAEVQLLIEAVHPLK